MSLRVNDKKLPAYLDAITGTTEGHLCVAVGLKPYRDDRGKYKHETWSEVTFAWPVDRRKAVDYIDQAATMGDVYVCPYLMKEPKRTKGLAAQRALVHADIDQELDEQTVKDLGGFIVRSGSSGHGHVYIRLAWPVTPIQHEALCRALAGKLGGDHKYSDNDLLRPPGTLNYKTAVDGGEPTPVEAVWCDSDKVDPRVLAGKIGVDFANPAVHTATPRTPGAVVDPCPIDPNKYPGVAEALAVDGGDRSADTFRIVGVCRRAGLTLAEATFVVRSRKDLADRLDERSRDDDLAAIWLKLDDEQRRTDRLLTPPPIVGEALDGVEVLDRLAAWFRRFICFTFDSDADLVALWTAHTHVAKELRISPRLHIDSITFGSGKTTLCEHLKALCINGLLTVGTSPAVIPRLVSMRMTTVLFDEVDRVLAPNKEGVGDLIAIINSGHRFGNVRTVLVPVKGGGWEPEEMSTFAAVALAGNSPQLPDDTLSRSLRVLLMPDNNGEAEDTDWPMIEGECKQLAADLALWANSIRDTISITGVTVDGARGRQLERWRSLKAVAYAAGGRWKGIVDRLIEHGLAEAQASKDAGITRVPPKVQLLHDLHATWANQPEFMASADLCDRLVVENRAYWGETATRTALTSQRMGKMLADATKQLASLETSKRLERNGPRGYYRAQFNPTWSRLGLPMYSEQSEHSVHSERDRRHGSDPTAPTAPTVPSTQGGVDG